MPTSSRLLKQLCCLNFIVKLDILFWKNLEWQILLVRREQIKKNTRRKLHNEKQMDCLQNCPKIYLQNRTKPIFPKIKEKKLTSVRC